MRKKSHVQGSIDGLCGIYCLVHFVERLPKLSKKARTKAHAAFAELLKDAQTLGLLDAQNIAGGYYAEDLVAIFNHAAARKRLPFVAAELTAVSNCNEAVSAIGLLRLIISQKGAAVVSICGGEHWVLAEAVGSENEIFVRDSGHSAKYRKEELTRVGNDLDGLAIIPRRSEIARQLRRSAKR